MVNTIDLSKSFFFKTTTKNGCYRKNNIVLKSKKTTLVQNTSFFTKGNRK